MNRGRQLPLRRFAAGAASAFATVLGVSARVAEQAANTLRGDQERGSETRPTAPSPDRDEAAQPSPPTAAPAADGSFAADIVDEGPGPVRVRPEPEVAPEVAHEPAPAPGPVAEAPNHRRRPETHAADLADHAAADVIDAIGELSTDELRALYEYESSHKRRKTVLAAIESALTPA